MASPKIYISHFQPSFVLQSETMVPIQVGTAISPVRLDMIGDDTGNNISEENPLYCELTAHYWAWKNDTMASHFGFFHYRRFLDMVGHKEHPKDTPHGIIEDEFGEGALHEFGLQDDLIREATDKYDLIIPRPYDVRGASFRNVEHHYRASPHHRAKDFQTAREVVASVSPEYSRYFEKMAKGFTLYPANIFIARRDIFEEYAAWIFPVLNAIRTSVDSSDYNAAEMRFVGYLAERLTTVFMLKRLEQNDPKRIRQVPLLHIKDARPQPGSPPLPHTDLPMVSVVASSDEAYAPHLAALITSVLRSASHERFLDFVVLGDGLSTHTRKALVALQRWHPHCSVSFVTMDRMFTKLKVHTYFARSTFYRLAMPEILSNRQKALFLDTDMVVLQDVSELFETELDGNLVAACKDLIMVSFRSLGANSMLEAGGKTAEVYLSDQLGMRGRTDHYFQAGTILFDLEAMRRTTICEDMVEDLRNRTFWFLDQDVLNKHLLGKVKFIHNRWNTVYMDDRHLGAVPYTDKQAYGASQDNPAIVHYAGVAKPWKNDDNPLGSHYWYFLRETLWYERMLISRMSSEVATSQQATQKRSMLKRSMSAIWRALPNSVRPTIGPAARFLAHRIQ